MTERRLAWLLTVATVIYMGFAIWRAWLLAGTGDPVAMVLGLAIIVIPAIGVYLLWREIRFGYGMQRMGRQLAEEGGLPPDDLPKAPSGRPDRDAADARFVERQADVEGDPADWRNWYRLAVAYDDARDRRRARAAMRQALRVYR